MFARPARPRNAAREQAEAAVRRFYQRLDGDLAARPLLAGTRVSIPEITALCTTTFAASLVELAPDEGLEPLARWRADACAQPSAGA